MSLSPHLCRHLSRCKPTGAAPKAPLQECHLLQNSKQQHLTQWTSARKGLGLSPAGPCCWIPARTSECTSPSSSSCLGPQTAHWGFHVLLSRNQNTTSLMWSSRAWLCRPGWTKAAGPHWGRGGSCTEQPLSCPRHGQRLHPGTLAASARRGSSFLLAEPHRKPCGIYSSLCEFLAQTRGKTCTQSKATPVHTGLRWELAWQEMFSAQPWSHRSWGGGCGTMSTIQTRSLSQDYFCSSLLQTPRSPLPISGFHHLTTLPPSSIFLAPSRRDQSRLLPT